MYRRVVIKIGSAVLTDEAGGVSRERILNIATLVSKLHEKGTEVILVSSGAVSAGYSKLQLDRKTIGNRQALASIGQSYLMSIYQKKFAKFGIDIAQILLTEADFDSRRRSENAKRTVDILLKNGVVPIINENDSVATDELVFGDNDQLSAHSTFYFDGDLLVILSDIDGYYDKNPRIYRDAKIIREVRKIEEFELIQEVTPHHQFATGGIVTKLKSAKFLMERGKKMFLTSGFNLVDAETFLLQGKYQRGTLFFKNW